MHLHDRQDRPEKMSEWWVDLGKGNMASPFLFMSLPEFEIQKWPGYDQISASRESLTQGSAVGGTKVVGAIESVAADVDGYALQPSPQAVSTPDHGPLTKLKVRTHCRCDVTCPPLHSACYHQVNSHTVVRHLFSITSEPHLTFAVLPCSVSQTLASIVPPLWEISPRHRARP